MTGAFRKREALYIWHKVIPLSVKTNSALHYSFGEILKKDLQFERISDIVAKVLIRSVGQAVKTPPSHGGNRGSIPLRTTKRNHALV